MCVGGRGKPFPVEGGVSIFPAIMLSIMHVVGEVRAIGHELLGHTAHVDACATETTETSLLPVATARALHLPMPVYVCLSVSACDRCRRTK